MGNDLNYVSFWLEKISLFLFYYFLHVSLNMELKVLHYTIIASQLLIWPFYVLTGMLIKYVYVFSLPFSTQLTGCKPAENHSLFFPLTQIILYVKSNYKKDVKGSL